MIALNFTGQIRSLSSFGTAPYWPPVTSDVVVDLSHWQAPIDFVKAKAAGIVAVILKATQGSQWIDATFSERSADATAAGLLVGAYHFLDNSAPERQMENFLSMAEGCPVLALDAEQNEIGGTVTVPQAAEAVGTGANGDRQSAARLYQPLWAGRAWDGFSEQCLIAVPALVAGL